MAREQYLYRVKEKKNVSGEGSSVWVEGIFPMIGK